MSFVANILASQLKFQRMKIKKQVQKRNNLNEINRIPSYLPPLYSQTWLIIDKTPSYLPYTLKPG